MGDSEGGGLEGGGGGLEEGGGGLEEGGGGLEGGGEGGLEGGGGLEGRAWEGIGWDGAGSLPVPDEDTKISVWAPISNISTVRNFIQETKEKTKEFF